MYLMHENLTKLTKYLKYSLSFHFRNLRSLFNMSCLVLSV